ncbi:MAG: IPT/TIG domain-containing protein [Chitinophagaceae bacterium]|nr:IPT/TIG domain-containing protein [Chitinophagaceae bacterium]
MKNSYFSFHWRSCIVLVAMLSILSCKKSDSAASKELSIVSFSPAEASEGASVVIKGIAFSDNRSLNTVKINNVIAAVTATAADGTELTITVPEDASTGKITVTVGDKTVSSATDLIVNPLAPVITAIAPYKGDIGTEVVITGNHFSTASEVYFGNIKATDVTFVGKTSLKAKVPAGVLNGKVKVKVATLEALSPTDFWVRPAITDILPEGAEENAIMEITGRNFSTVVNDNTVFFGPIPATVIGATAERLRVRVPIAAPNDFIKVVVKEQEAISALKFRLLPTLSSFSPEAVDRNGRVTITGKNLSGSEVYLNKVKLQVTYIDATTIEVQIPSDANNGNLVVRQGGLDFQFFTELRIVNFWKEHDLQASPVIYRQSSQFVYNGKVYFAFGYDNASTGALIWMTKVRSYDPINKKWKEEFDIPAKVPVRREHFSALIGNKWYFGGGDSPGGNGVDSWVMDLSQSGDGAFKQLTNLTKGTMGDRAFVLNNELYVAARAYEKQMLRLDPAANNGKGSWNAITPIDITVPILDGITTVGNKAYFLDGYSNFYEFDPTLPAITTKRSLPNGSYAVNSLIGFNGKCYCSDGNTFWEYTPAQNNWIIKGNAPPGELKTFMVGNRIFGFTFTGQVYEYIYQ